MTKATKAVRTPRAAKKIPSRHAAMLAICIGLALIGLAIFMTLSFITADVGVDINASAETCWTGLLGAWMAFGTIFTLGKTSAFLLAVLIACWGVHIAANARVLATWPQVFGGLLILSGFALGVCALGERYDMTTGGLLAVYASPPAILYFGRWGLVLAATGIVILGILLAFGESAIAFVHQTVFFLRDAVFGLAGMGARLRYMFKLLFNPRLAVAHSASADAISSTAPAITDAEETSPKKKRFFGKDTVKPDAETAGKNNGNPNRSTRAENENSRANNDENNETKQETVREETSSVLIPPPESHAGLKDWKPRESFQSRFLNLDPTGDIPTLQPPIQAVEAAIADTAEPRPDADVIMDVDALTEESDQITIGGNIRPEDDKQPDETDDAQRDAASSRVEKECDIPATPFNAKAEEIRKSTVRQGPETEIIPPPVKQFQIAQQQVQHAPPQPQPSKPAPAPRPEPRTSAKSAAPEEKQGAAGSDDELANYTLPDIELLDPPEPPVVEDRSIIEEKAKILERTLAEFKIEGKVVHVECGPRVTMYEISLAPGIRLSKVTSLADNIAMQLQAESVRIIAPIPGKNTIGIEIPNICKELVSLREIVAAVNREKKRQALPVCLGKDVSGAALVADLARMPHLLIAGATGSGKSVCINSIILSVMMCCKPDETQMILVDPKVVELSRFKDIPHLMSPVITDMKRAVSVLEWICQKMDERYEQLSQVSVNNIAKFNALGEQGIREKLDEFASLEEIEAFPKKLPYMVVIIDELADLMMVAGKEVEHHITRLAAKSRAVGIHLILATQRPSVDVITGLIKANMPCRIAFQVASRVDSRTILDQNGAETLLGQGDMLYLPPGVGKLTRAQGVFVSDEELFRVVDFVKSEAQPQYHEDLTGPVIGCSGGKVDVSSFDELFIQSGESIIENQRGSVSLLQRKFGIGYGRASRIIDQLASVGLLGPFRDGKARAILLTMEEFRAKFGIVGDDGDWGDDDEGSGCMAGLRDDEREPVQPDWGDEDGER